MWINIHLIYMMNIKILTGKLDADVVHENVCRLHLELFDTYLKGIKDRPEIESNESVVITEYPPDMSE